MASVKSHVGVVRLLLGAGQYARLKMKAVVYVLETCFLMIWPLPKISVDSLVKSYSCLNDGNLIGDFQWLFFDSGPGSYS